MQLNQYSQGGIEVYTKIIKLVISCITFCGFHDFSLKGKDFDERILDGLYKLRINPEDLVLKKHIEHGKKNVSY